MLRDGRPIHIYGAKVLNPDGMLNEVKVKMKRSKRSVMLASLMSLSLVMSMLGGILLNGRAIAATNKGDKVAVDLHPKINASTASEDIVQVIVQLNGVMSGELN